MRTRFAYLISSVFAVLVVSSCEKDPSMSAGSKGHFTVSFSVWDGSSTKGDSDRIDATESESAVNPETLKMFMVKCDTNGNPDTTTAVLPLTEFEDKTASGSSKTQLEVRFSGTGSYLLYAIANCPSTLTPDLTNYNKFIGEYTSSGSDFAIDGKFLMFNRQTGVGGCGGVQISLDGTEDISVEIPLERVAAKIEVAESDFIDFAPYHTVVIGSDDDYAVSSMKLDGVALLNCVNRYYLQQHWNNGTNTGDKLLVTPSSDPTYSKDYYYNVDPSAVTLQELNSKNEFEPMYCLENNSPYYTSCIDTDTYTEDGSTIDLTYLKDHAVDKTKMKGRVTGVLFRAQFKVADGFQAGLGTNPLIGDEDGEWATKASSDPQESIRTLYKYKGIYYCDQRALFEHNGGTIGSLTPAVPTDPDEYDLGLEVDDLRANGVNVYEDGHVYYTYWIVDPNHSDGDNPGYVEGDPLDEKPYHYHSVMRNTLYKLTVESVTSFGDELPGGDYHRIDPVGEKSPRISVSIIIANWTDVDAHYTL